MLCNHSVAFLAILVKDAGNILIDFYMMDTASFSL